MTTASLTDIHVGDRDRFDLGDIDALAKSISEIGLLHPVVITRDRDLVAGGRRLAAVQSLGWIEVPVTVVDLSTVAQVLQAEADENTCRKGLTPVEASEARRRRVRVLAPKAAERKAQAPGAPQGAKARPVSSSKLDEEKPASARAVRKVAAIGTGYSGSTLDKVDRIRDVAEKGVVKVARVEDGKAKTIEVPAPAPVVEVAKKALADVSKTGAAIDRSSQNLQAAVEAYVAPDPEIKRLHFLKAFLKAESALLAITEYSPEDVAAALDADQFDDLQGIHRSINNWFVKLREARPTGLRVVNGGLR